MALVQEGEEVVLALLLQNRSGRKGGSIRLFPLNSLASHEVPPPDSSNSQVWLKLTSAANSCWIQILFAANFEEGDFEQKFKRLLLEELLPLKELLPPYDSMY